MSEIWLIGSGPSADLVQRIPKSAQIACVNGSHVVPARCPDIYLVGEIEAAQRNAGPVHSYVGAGVDVFMRPTALDALRAKLPGCAAFDQITPVAKDFGPERLRALHSDVPMPGGERAPWVSSGVLLLWVLAEVYKPSRIVVAGLDGYPTDPSAPTGEDARQGHKHLQGEYAQGVEALPSRPARSAAWCQAMNDRMSNAIGLLTDHYCFRHQVRFQWLRKPLLWSERWTATIRGRRD